MGNVEKLKECFGNHENAQIIAGTTGLGAKLRGPGRVSHCGHGV